MKELCNGKINNNGICEKCYELSQSTSGYCVRFVDVQEPNIGAEDSQGAERITTNDLKAIDQADEDKLNNPRQ